MSSERTQVKPPRNKAGPNASISCNMPSQTTQVACPSNKAEPVASVSYNCTEFLEALKSIQLVFQCYVCHMALLTARTCLNGHGICYNCKNRCNKRCPLCKSVILETKPVMLNHVMKLLPRSCTFSIDGCNSFVLANDKDHEKFCRFRQTNCRMPCCIWNGMAKDLLLHLEKLHTEEVIRTPSQTKILMSFNAGIDKEGLAVIVAFNNIFWQHVRVRQNHLVQFYQYIPMERPTKKYSVYISYHTPIIRYANSTPVHTDTLAPIRLLKDKETFRLPKKTAISFNSFHSGVHYTCEITERDI